MNSADSVDRATRLFPERHTVRFEGITLSNLNTDGYLKPFPFIPAPQGRVSRRQ